MRGTLKMMCFKHMVCMVCDMEKLAAALYPVHQCSLLSMASQSLDAFSTAAILTDATLKEAAQREATSV